MTTWRNSVPSRDELHKAKREAMLREAASAFNRRGFHATSLDDIARSLGVTKAALYHYFPNKDALLRACFAKAMEIGFASLERAKRDGRTGQEKLRLTLSGYLEQMIDELNCCVVLLEDTSLTPEGREEVVRERDRFERALRALVREGIADGSIVPCDPKLVVFAILGAFSWVPKWFRPTGPWSAGDTAAALTELFDRALSSKPAKMLTQEVGQAEPTPTRLRAAAGRGARRSLRG
jgi:TetR/AcrR family transcriptional regulator